MPNASNSEVYDGVIIGAGAAGLLAALHAADRGARVALLDISEGEQSNITVSTGLVSAAGTRFQKEAGVDDSPARWAGDIRRKCNGDVDPVVVALVTERSADAVHFVADRLGLDIHLAVGLTMPGHTATRLHATSAESGRQFSGMLLDAVRRQPLISLFTKTEATDLIARDGTVLGVHTNRGDFRARHTLLACGGFAGNPEMIAHHAPEISKAVNIGRGPNDGRAIQWGAALGANLLFMDSYQGQGHTTPDGKGRLGPGLTSFGAIVVNSHGERFADDAMGPSEFGAFVLAQPGGTAVEIFDKRIHDAAIRLSSYREVVERNGVVTANTTADLAAAFDLPVAALERTMAEHKAAVAGAPDRFGRTIALLPLEPPYMAARVTGALAHTQGGLQVDSACRVIRQDGTPIPGLLAAGGAAVSISGHGAAGYLPGNGLGHAFTLGFVAGETMAQPLL